MAHFFMLESQSDFCFALAIVQQERLTKCHFIISNPSAIRGLELIFAATLKTEHNLNLFLHNPFSKSSKFKDGISSIKRTIKKNRSKVSTFYLFDDSVPMAQYLNRHLLKPNDQSCLVQSDLSLYFDQPARRGYSLLKRIQNKFKYGMFWQGFALGQLRTHNRIYALKPEFLSNPYKSQTVIEVQMVYFFSALWRNISVAILNQKFDDFFDLKSIHKIIILPKVETENEFNAISVEFLQRFGVDNKRNIFIKNHAESLYNLKPKSGRNMALIPSEVPAESILIFSKEIESSLYLPTSYLMILARMNEGKMSLNSMFNNMNEVKDSSRFENEKLVHFFKS